MHARLTFAQVAPDSIDEAVGLWRDSVMADAKAQAGFNSARLLVNRATGRLISMGLWESQTQLEATGESSPYKQAQLAKFAGLFTAPPTVEHFEVAAQA